MRQTQQDKQQMTSRYQDGPLHAVERRWLVTTGHQQLEGPFDSQEEAEEALYRSRHH